MRPRDLVAIALPGAIVGALAPLIVWAYRSAHAAGVFGSLTGYWFRTPPHGFSTYLVFVGLLAVVPAAALQRVALARGWTTGRQVLALALVAGAIGGVGASIGWVQSQYAASALSGGVGGAGSQAWQDLAWVVSQPASVLLGQALAPAIPMGLLVAVRVRRWSLGQQLRLTVPASVVGGTGALMLIAGYDLEEVALNTPNIWVVLGMSVLPLVFAATDRLERRLFGPDEADVTLAASAP